MVVGRTEGGGGAVGGLVGGVGGIEGGVVGWVVSGAGGRLGQGQVVAGGVRQVL